MSGELINLVPEMTSNTEPDGLVIFNQSIEFPEYQAFDSVDRAQSYVSGINDTGYIGYLFGNINKHHKLQSYVIRTNDHDTFSKTAPTAWIFQGSNDTTNGKDGTWFDLDSQNVGNNYFTERKKDYEFNLNTGVMFKAYRIKVESYNTSLRTWWSIGQLKFIGIALPIENYIKVSDGYIKIHENGMVSTVNEPTKVNLPLNISVGLSEYLSENYNGIFELVSCNPSKEVQGISVQTTHELNLLQDDLLQADEVKILNMHEKGEEFNVGVTFIPDHALLLASGDIKLKSIGNIDYFKVDATAIDDAEVKMIVSVDEGEIWNAYNGDWYEVEPDADVVLEKGTPAGTFNNIPPSAWNELRKFSDTIRFGYLINGRATVHALHSQFDMSGTWKSAYHGEHYDYEYTDNSTMHITLKIDGDYKINY